MNTSPELSPSSIAEAEVASQTSKAILARDLKLVDAGAGFRFFTYQIFSESFGRWYKGTEYKDGKETEVEYFLDNFVGGKYIDEVTERFDANPWTIDVTGRKHFKSTRLYARIMYLFLKNREKGGEGHYFSFSKGLAGYHLKHVKDMIRANPYFADFVDMKPTSDSILEYRYKGTGPKLSFTPQGLQSFNRGVHGDWIFIDDPFKDEEDKLNPIAVYKINRVVRLQIRSMVNEGGELRAAGTPQTLEDFYFDKKFTRSFSVEIRPAVVDLEKKIALWPEKYSFEWLMNMLADIGEKAFNQEYNAEPAYTQASYIGREKLKKATTNEAGIPTDRPAIGLAGWVIVAGWDLGKKSHPAHASFLGMKYVAGLPIYRQLVSKWWDGVDYTEHLEWLITTGSYLGLSRLEYDNTRGELEVLEEKGEVPDNFFPVVLGSKIRNGIAVALEAAVSSERITFVADERQYRQTLSVTNDLDAPSSKEGHGDSFWSNGLGIHAGGEAIGSYVDRKPTSPDDYRRRRPTPTAANPTAGVYRKDF